MQASLKITDHITRPLASAIAAAKSSAFTEAMGAEVVSIGQRAFNDAALRPSRWPERSDGSPATLKISGALWHSLRIVSLSTRSVTVGSDRPYAAIHQTGGHTKPRVITAQGKRALFWPGARHPVRSVKHPGSKIPARPYFPITTSNQFTPYAQGSIAAILTAKLRAILRH